MSLGLVGHAHPFQGEVAALDEIVAHLIRRRQTDGEREAGEEEEQSEGFGPQSPSRLLDFRGDGFRSTNKPRSR